MFNKILIIKVDFGEVALVHNCFLNVKKAFFSLKKWLHTKLHYIIKITKKRYNFEIFFATNST